MGLLSAYLDGGIINSGSNSALAVVVVYYSLKTASDWELGVIMGSLI